MTARSPYYKSLTPLLPWRQVSLPFSWPDWFGRGAPLEVELGCGNGERLVRRALANPELNLVGIDNSWPALKRSLRKTALAGVNNLCLVLAPAHFALARLFAPGQIQAAEVLFPRPWPARIHAKNRLLSRKFLSLLNNRLAPGGAVYLVTDYKPYLDWTLEQAPPGAYSANSGTRSMGLDTKYERRWASLGQREFYQLTLAKRQNLAWPDWEEVALRDHFLENFQPRGFPGGEHNLEGLFISFKDLLYDESLGRALIRALVVEDDLKQSILLEATRREEGWRLRVASGCGMIPTVGVGACLELAAKLGGQT